MEDRTENIVPGFFKRPHGILDLVNASFRVYSRNLLGLLGVTAPVVFLFSLILTSLVRDFSFENLIINAGVEEFVPMFFLNLILVQTFDSIIRVCTLFLIVSAMVSILQGKPVSLKAVRAVLIRRPGRWIGLFIKFWFFYWLMSVPVAFVSCLGFILVPLFLWAYASSIPILFFEEISPNRVMHRSRKLSGSRFLHFSLLWLVTQVGVHQIMESLIQLPVTLASQALMKDPQSSVVFLGLLAAARGGSQCIAQPVFPIALTLYYFDMRVRSEGMDLFERGEKLGLPVSSGFTLGTAGGTS